MIISGIIIAMLNFIIFGIILVLDFELFSRLTSVSASISGDALTESEQSERHKAQKKSSLQTAA